MTRALRYRHGICRRTGQVLAGRPHLLQSLEVIWTTKLNTRVMRLAFGSDTRGVLAEDVTPAMVLLIYDRLIASAHRWEPEYRLAQLQLVRLTEDGVLGLKHSGLYFPEGRYGNYEDVEPLNDAEALGLPQWLGRAAA